MSIRKFYWLLLLRECWLRCFCLYGFTAPFFISNTQFLTMRVAYRPYPFRFQNFEQVEEIMEAAIEGF